MTPLLHQMTAKTLIEYRLRGASLARLGKRAREIPRLDQASAPGSVRFGPSMVTPLFSMAIRRARSQLDQ